MDLVLVVLDFNDSYCLEILRGRSIHQQQPTILVQRIFLSVVVFVNSELSKEVIFREGTDG